MAVRSKTFSDWDPATEGWREITPTRFEIAQPLFNGFEAPRVAYQGGSSHTPVDYANDMLVGHANELPVYPSDMSRHLHELTGAPHVSAGISYHSGELGKVPCGPWSMSSAAHSITPDRVSSVIYEVSGALAPSTEPAIVPSGFAAATPAELLTRLGVPTNSFEAVVRGGGRLQGAKAQLETSAQVLELWRKRVVDSETLLRGLQAELTSVVTSLQIFWNTGRLPTPGTSLAELSTKQARLDSEVESAESALAQAKSSLADARAAYDGARTAYETLLRSSAR